MIPPLPETDSTIYSQVDEESYYRDYPEDGEEILVFSDTLEADPFGDEVALEGADLYASEMALDGNWGWAASEDDFQTGEAYSWIYPSPDLPIGRTFHPLVLTPLAILVVAAGLLLISLTVLRIGPGSSVGITIGDTTTQGSGGGKPVEGQNPSTSGIATIFTPSVQYWGSKIVEWSQKWSLDPNLVATVMQIESCGDPNALSSAGAMGLFQVMPFHFDAGENGFDPQTNAKRGLAYLQQSLEAHNGDQGMALAGYNGGISGSQRPASFWANETQRYFYWGTGIYEDAAAGKGQSSRLQEWLDRGGAGLCQKASQQLGINQ